jgi:hypothetical protein
LENQFPLPFVLFCSFFYYTPQFLSTSTHTLSQTISLGLEHRTEHFMAAWTAANLARLSSPKSASSAQAASLIHRRGLAGGGGNLSFPFLSLLHVWLLRKNSGGKKKIKRK